MRTILLWNDDWRMADAPRTLGDTGYELVRDRRAAPLADAIVFHLPSLDLASLPTGRRPGQRWVAWWQESEVNYPFVDAAAFMAAFDLTMTHRRPADVWATYVPGEDELLRPPVAKSEAAPAVYIASNPRDLSGRDAYVAELMRHVAVDAYGRQLNNRAMHDDDGRRAKLRTIARYRFTLAFENSIARDYVTEKFFDALCAGSVPIVLGAPNVAEFAPSPGSYLDVADFDGPRSLAARIAELCADEAAYASALRWKSEGYSPAFRELLASGTGDPWTRLALKLRST
jgi:alpha-1,3-fucosyltransferase 10